MISAADVAARASKSQRIAGGRMICCPAPYHDDRTPSCKVWDGPDGSVMFHCFGGCDWRDVRAGAEALGLVPAWQPSKPAPISNARRREVERARRDRDRAEARDRERKRKWAKEIWDSAREISDTPAAAYLASRSIKPPYPDSLRFAPRLGHPVVEHNGPAMVARVSSLDGKGLAVHLTFLDGNRKAAIDPVKVIIGPARGGAVHLSKPRGALAIAEGIETALAVQQSTGIRTWAALNTSQMKCLELPPRDEVAQLYLAADGDKPGRDAAESLARRARLAGHSVRIVSAPDGFDWNDVLKGVAA